MPILEIEIVLRPDEELTDDLPQLLADRLGDVFRSQPGETWLKLRPLPGHHYTENESTDDIYPVFVTVLKGQRPSIDEMQIEVTALTTAVADICQRPFENVHIIYQPDALGRIAFGGKIASKD